MMAITKVDDNNFQTQVMDSALPVIVDFGAEWCGPCRLVDPLVEEIAHQYEGKVKVCKSDVDQTNQMAAKFGIMAIPTVMFFKNGEEVDRVTGVVPRDKLEEKVQAILQYRKV